MRQACKVTTVAVTLGHLVARVLCFEEKLRSKVIFQIYQVTRLVFVRGAKECSLPLGKIAMSIQIENA